MEGGRALRVREALTGSGAFIRIWFWTIFFLSFAIDSIWQQQVAP